MSGGDQASHTTQTHPVNDTSRDVEAFVVDQNVYGWKFHEPIGTCQRAFPVPWTGGWGKD